MEAPEIAIIDRMLAISKTETVLLQIAFLAGLKVVDLPTDSRFPAWVNATLIFRAAMKEAKVDRLNDVIDHVERWGK
jgi:hypothetical protein